MVLSHCGVVGPSQCWWQWLSIAGALLGKGTSLCSARISFVP